jgi:hypothetical protein
VNVGVPIVAVPVDVGVGVRVLTVVGGTTTGVTVVGPHAVSDRSSAMPTILVPDIVPLQGKVSLLPVTLKGSVILVLSVLTKNSAPLPRLTNLDGAILIRATTVLNLARGKTENDSSNGECLTHRRG